MMRRTPNRRQLSSRLRPPRMFTLASNMGSATERLTAAWAARWATTSGRSASKRSPRRALRRSRRWKVAPGFTQAGLPVARLSNTVTSCPSRTNASTTCEPMNPAPPVTKILISASRFRVSGFGCGVSGVWATRRVAPTRNSKPSDGVLVDESLPETQPEDLQIEGQGPVFNVVEVALDPLLERGIAPPAVYLGPPGNPCLHLVPEHIFGDPLSKLLDEDRPFRAGTHQAHLAPQDIEQLGQLIQRGQAQHGANRRSAPVVAGCPNRPGVTLSVVSHGSELQHLKRPAVEAHPLLAVEDRTGRRQLDDGRKRQLRRRRDQEGDARQHDIHDPLGDQVPTVEGRVLQVHQGKTIKLLHPSAKGHVLVEIGDHLDIHEFLLKAPEDPLHPTIRLEGNCDEELID